MSEMRLLLDTHALLWWLDGDVQLSLPAREAIANQQTVVLVSAASAWEIATKVRIGKLPGAIHVIEHLAEILDKSASNHVTLQPVRIGCRERPCGTLDTQLAGGRVRPVRIRQVRATDHHQV